MRKLPMQIKVRFLSDRVSKILFTVCIIFLLLLVAAQIFLKNERTREIFTPIEKYEKISYASNEAFKEGYVILKLESGKASDKTEIWFNGEKIDVFKSKKQKVVIECDGVIEVKNDSGGKITVSVDSVSKNIELLMNNKPEINAGIRVVCSVSFKK